MIVMIMENSIGRAVIATIAKTNTPEINNNDNDWYFGMNQKSKNDEFKESIDAISDGIDPYLKLLAAAQPSEPIEINPDSLRHYNRRNNNKKRLSRRNAKKGYKRK